MPLDMTGSAGAAHWVIGRHELRAADCLDGLADLADASVDVIVTSPPYNIGIAYRSYDDRQPRCAYLAWLARVSQALRRVLRPAGALFLNIGSTNTDPWLAQDAAAAFRADFVLQNHVSWVKSLSIGDDTVGHFKPITSRRFLNQNHESVYHFTPTGTVPIDRLAIGVPFKDKSNIARWGHVRDRRCAGNVWFIPYKTVRSKAQKFDHPAGFPVELPTRCLQLHGGTDLVVLDPFAGTGTTLVAAHRLGHRGIGLELDPHYAQTAAQRLTAEMGDASIDDQGQTDHRAGGAVAGRDPPGAADQRRRRAGKVP